MRIARQDIDVKLELPGAVIRQRLDFGDATGCSTISAEYFSLAAGVDTTGLFQGLEHDACQCPHWGYVLKGTLATVDEAGTTETVRAGDLFYWPAGHNVKVSEDSEIVMFSPQREHTLVIDHMREKIKGM